MAATMIEELAEHPKLLHRHAVPAYSQMLAAGIIDEGAPFELLDGQIVRKIRIQSPVTLPPYDMPEPDGLIVRGTNADFVLRHPVEDEVPCVIDRVVEVYSEPVKLESRYTHFSKLSIADEIALPTHQGPTLNVPVKQLLP